MNFHFVFSLPGYSTAFTVQELDEKELLKLKEFAKTIPEQIGKYCSENKIDRDHHERVMICRLFLGIHEDAPSFQIFHGEQMLLLRVAKWVQEKVGRESIDDFSSFSENNLSSQQHCLTRQTVVGILFTSEGRLHTHSLYNLLKLFLFVRIVLYINESTIPNPQISIFLAKNWLRMFAKWTIRI